MPICSTTTVGGVAVKVPGGAQILENLGIDYCCGGERSLADACLAAGVPVRDVLSSLEKAEQSTRASSKFFDWSSASLSQLVAYIIDKHHAFTRKELERLEPVVVRVRSAHVQNHPELLSIQELFGDLKDELLPHMQKEELVLFPYVNEIDKAVTEGGVLRWPPFGRVLNPISIMLAEHDKAGDTFRKMRELSSNFFVPADGCASYRELYAALEALEADLHLHIHLENNLLFPRAINMENDVRQVSD